MKTCFSTEAVDLNNQAPNRNKRESKYYWDELYRLIAAAEFSSIEVPYEAKWDFGGRSGIPRSMRSVTVKYGTVQNYMQELKAIGIEEIGCIHLDPSLFCSGMVEMYFGAFQHYAGEAVQFAKEAGTKVLTLTATPSYYAVRAIMNSTENPDAEKVFLEKTAQAVEHIAGAAEEAGVKLCLKNEYWGLLRGEKIVPFINSLKKQVFLDVDTANLQIAGVDVCRFIRENKEKIGVVHFTDTSFVDDQEAYLQALPEYPAKAAAKVICDVGEGKVDFKGIQKALQDAAYDGTIVYTCRNSYDIYRSILRTRYAIKHSLSE